MMQSRTHNCNQLRIENVGEKVKLVGWMENVREVGGNLAFVVLRDFYGTTQVVVEDEADAEGHQGRSTRRAPSPSRAPCASARARTASRPPARSRSCPRRSRCSAAAATIPCPSRSTAAARPTRTQRLKYRYLDLRNPAVKKNIILRCQVDRRAAPGDDGARLPGDHDADPDRLLPRGRARLSRARAQAPGQVLRAAAGPAAVQAAADDEPASTAISRSRPASVMRTRAATAPPASSISWIWRWRSPRRRTCSPSARTCCRPSSRSIGTYDIASQRAVPPHRVSARRMEVYGSDKPDLRIDLTATDVTELFAENEFEALRGQTVKAVPITDCKLTRKQIDKLLRRLRGAERHEEPIGSRSMRTASSPAASASSSPPIKAELTEKLGLKPDTLVIVCAGKLATRGPRASPSRPSAPPARVTWTRSATSSAGSSISRCTRSARRAASWSSATTRSRCPRAAWRRCWPPSAASSTR